MFTINAERYIRVNRKKHFQNLQRYQAALEGFEFETLANESSTVTHPDFNKRQPLSRRGQLN